MKRYFCKIIVYLNAESEKEATQLMENWLDSAEDNRINIGLDKYPNDGYCDYIEVKEVKYES